MFYTTILVLLFLLKIRKFHENVTNYIKSRYGEHGYNVIWLHINTRKKCLKSALDNEFLKNCKAHNIFPKFLRYKLYKKCLQSAAFYKSWQTKLLTREIQFKRKAEQRLPTKVILIENEIITNFHHLMLLLYFDIPIKLLITSNRQLSPPTGGSSFGIDSTLKPLNPDTVISNYSSVVVLLG